ncbi:Crp/Fnr family transcriptional regulator [Amylibacter marinus]|uniref:Crp/Fnr family transcriptional regulator n=1 Tax=Amylibacter marinus TaxID=1475483 RepID=A0ABQ5VW92_9RHOB|nr:Crp/Fnr family transcriptional regulator [Amylibacter marinus]GLQ35697.1 Crp/Fnr family transcriptional regulator [Amylibacter marinus]
MLRNELTFPKDSFLGRINQDSWDLLSSRWTTQIYKSGQFLITDDETDRDVYFVLRGSCKATIYTDSGREVSFISVATGDCFGEFSALDDSPRSASVVASEECLAARIDQANYIRLMQSHSDMTFALLNILIGHLRRLSKRVVDFNAKNADQRLHDALLDLALKYQRGGADSVLIPRPPTQSELAAFIFSSRESVAREMGKMRKLGLLARQKRALEVPSIQALRDFIDEN